MLSVGSTHTPTTYVFDSRTGSADGLPGWFMPYFQQEPLVEDRTEDYADLAAVLSRTGTYEWLHPLSRVVTTLIGSGLCLDQLTEYDAAPWAMFTCLVRDESGLYRWPDKPWLPLLRAADKPARPLNLTAPAYRFPIQGE